MSTSSSSGRSRRSSANASKSRSWFLCGQGRAGIEQERLARLARREEAVVVDARAGSRARARAARPDARRPRGGRTATARSRRPRSRTERLVGMPPEAALGAAEEVRQVEMLEVLDRDRLRQRPAAAAGSSARSGRRRAPRSGAAAARAARPRGAIASIRSRHRARGAVLGHDRLREAAARRPAATGGTRAR